MKKLLYIGCPYFGENLFGTPCMEFFSKEYEVTLITSRWNVNFFKKYPFLTNVLPSDNVRGTLLDNVKLPLGTIHAIKEIFSPKDVQAFYIAQNDWDADLFRSHELNYFTKLDVISDKDLNHNLSRTKKYLHKMKLAVEDRRIRVPPYTPPETPSNLVVIYEGSEDYLRRLSPEVLNYFSMLLPDAVFLLEKNIADLLNFDGRNIKYISTLPSEYKNLNAVVELFQSRPKVVIGPDSGLTNLALGYNIPCVWMESRVRIENTTDRQHDHLVTVVRRNNLPCNNDCNARKYYNQIGGNIIDTLPPLIAADTHPDELKCRSFHFSSIPCLDYSFQEIKEIVSKIK